MVLPPGHRGNFPRVIPAKKFRAACYTIEGLNSFAVVIYFNYLYFSSATNSVSTTGRTSNSRRSLG